MKFVLGLAMLTLAAHAQNDTARNVGLGFGIFTFLTVVLPILTFVACLIGFIYSVVRFCKTKKQTRLENAEIKRNQEKMENYLTKREIEA